MKKKLPKNYDISPDVNQNTQLSPDGGNPVVVSPEILNVHTEISTTTSTTTTLATTTTTTTTTAAIPKLPIITSITPNSGFTYGNTTIIIIGSNLYKTKSIVIGGVPVKSFNIISPTHITAITGANTSGYSTLVLTTDTGTVTKINAFNYIIPLPTITSISPTEGLIEGGTIVNITGTNLFDVISVIVGEHLVSFYEISKTVLRIITNPSTTDVGVKNITVQTKTGSVTLSNAFTYVYVPTPTTTTTTAATTTTTTTAATTTTTTTAATTTTTTTPATTTTTTAAPTSTTSTTTAATTTTTLAPTTTTTTTASPYLRSCNSGESEWIWRGGMFSRQCCDCTGQDLSTYCWDVSTSPSGSNESSNNNCNCCRFETTTTQAPATVPDAVTGITVSYGEYTDKISISWTLPALLGFVAVDPADPNQPIDFYNVYRDMMFITSGLGSSYDDSGATPGVLHAYEVLAHNGYGYSPDSAIVTGWRKLEQPINLITSKNDTTGITSTWDSVAGATSYNIYRGTDPSTMTLLTTTPSNSYFDSYVGLNRSSLYYYKISAGCSLGEGETSGISFGNLKIAPPIISTSINTPTGDIKINWSDIDSAANYEIYRGSSANTAAMTLINSSTISTSYIDNDIKLVMGTTYYYSVKSVNGFGSSEFSNVASKQMAALPTPINSADYEIWGVDFGSDTDPTNSIFTTNKGVTTVVYPEIFGENGQRNSNQLGYPLSTSNVILTDTGDLITLSNGAAHGYLNGYTVSFYNIVNTTGLNAGQIYYVINKTNTTFQVSATLGGSAVTLTTNGTATSDIESSWNKFKTWLSSIPAGRRVIGLFPWWRDIAVYMETTKMYYQETGDGTTYNNKRFLTQWADQNASDSAASFTAFLNKCKTYGVSFDYAQDDKESWSKWILDGNSARSEDCNAQDYGSQYTATFTAGSTTATLTGGSNQFMLDGSSPVAIVKYKCIGSGAIAKETKIVSIAYPANSMTFTISPAATGSGNITFSLHSRTYSADSRLLKAMFNDNRFFNKSHPVTGKTFAQEFIDNYNTLSGHSHTTADCAELLRPYLNLSKCPVTGSESAGDCYPTAYWTPYGGGVGNGHMGNGYSLLDAQNKGYISPPYIIGAGPNNTTGNAYSIVSYLIPAWENTVLNWQIYYMNTYCRNSLQKFDEFKNVKYSHYEWAPISLSETPYTQDSNIQAHALPYQSDVITGNSFYGAIYGSKNLWIYGGKIGTFSGPTNGGESLASWLQDFSYRSGYVATPNDQWEKWTWPGFLDVPYGGVSGNAALTRYPSSIPVDEIKFEGSVSGTTLTVTKILSGTGSLIGGQIPDTTVSNVVIITSGPTNGGIGTYRLSTTVTPASLVSRKWNSTTWKKMYDEGAYKIFVDYIKESRHSLRSNINYHKTWAPWIGPGFGWGNDLAYWYELIFHIFVSGCSYLQLFDIVKIGFTSNVQIALDIWRNLSKNSKTIPCTNSTGDTLQLVDRLEIGKCFTKYTISGGKTEKSGLYIWRITLAPEKFYTNSTVTLQRVGSDSDIPATITINSLDSDVTKQRGFWITRNVSTPPEYV